MPPPAAARHTTTERERRWGTARRPRAVLGFGLSAIQLHLVRRQHRFNSFVATPSVFFPLAQVHGAASGCARPHANERAIWRP